MNSVEYFKMGVFDPGCLKGYCIILGTFLLFISLGGIGFSLFLLFGEPLAKQTYHTYRPNWEEIGKIFLVCFTVCVST